MKQKMPKWAVIAAIAAGIGAIVAVGIFAGEQPDFANPNPPPKVIPKYIYDTMSPEEQRALQEQGIKVEENVELPKGIPGQAEAGS